MARKTKSQKMDDIHVQALKRYNAAKTSDYDSREQALDDIAFAQAEGNQWDQRYGQSKDRPRFEINKIQFAINQVIGQFTRQKMSTNTRPTTANAEPKVAGVFNGIIRNIFNKSMFSKIQVEALKEVATGGFGAWRVCTDFLDDESFDQEISLKWIPDAVNTVWFEYEDRDSLKRNARCAFIAEDIPRERFKELYPDSQMSSFDKIPNLRRLRRDGWSTQDTIRVMEYFYKERINDRLLELSDGRVVLHSTVKDVLEEMAEGESPVTVIRERKIKRDRVMWCKVSGTEVLTAVEEFPSKHIPVFPVYGFNYWIEGQHLWRGMVRFAKDPQRIYNHIVSAKVEAATNSPKDPIFVTPDMVGEYEDEYKNFNLRNSPFMFYDPGDTGLTPLRLGPPPVQPALTEIGQQADMDIKATLGTNEASLGNVPMGANAPSGAAVMAIQQQSNVGHQELIQNLADAVEYTGNVLIDMIPRVYDYEAQIRTMNPDDSTEFVPINKEEIDVENNTKTIVNDLAQGKYDLSVSLGPSFATQREETLAMITAISANDPELMGLTADILVKNLDHPESVEITKRVRRSMIEKGLIRPNEEEAEEIAELAASAPEPSPLEQMQFKQQGLTLEHLAAQIDLLEADLLEKQSRAHKNVSQSEKTEAETAKVFSDIMISEFKEGMALNQQAMEAMQLQLDNAVVHMNSGMNEAVNTAFANVAPGLYQTDDGTVVNVDDQGQMLPVDMAAQLPPPNATPMV